jgi:hypothetical protein
VRSYSTRFLWASFHFVEKTPKGRSDHAMIRRQQQQFVRRGKQRRVLCFFSTLRLIRTHSMVFSFVAFGLKTSSGLIYSLESGEHAQVQSVTSLCPNLWGWFVGWLGCSCDSCDAKPMPHYPDVSIRWLMVFNGMSPLCSTDLSHVLMTNLCAASEQRRGLTAWGEISRQASGQQQDRH